MAVSHQTGTNVWLPYISWQTLLCLTCLSNISSWNRILNLIELAECVKVRDMLYKRRKREVLVGPLRRKLLETNKKPSLPI